MPTGYTSDIYDGKELSVEDFAERCAHAFGVFVHLRDDMSTALSYPKAPDNDYYHTSLNEANRELRRWRSLSEEQKYAEWSDYFKQASVELQNRIAESAELRARYHRMLAKVKNVDVPSKLENFKKFMIDQLEQSIEHDCGSDDKFEKSWYQPTEYVQWCEKRDERSLNDVAYYTEQLAKAEARYKETVEYIDLMSSTFGFKVEKANA